MRANLEQVKLTDKIFSTASYISAGWAGMIILVIMYFLRKTPSKFLQFNVFQSIFISLSLYVISKCLELIAGILSYIPLINTLTAQIGFLLNRPFFGEYSLLQTFLIAIILYGCTFSLMGKKPRIPGVSKIIDYAVR
ncbi:MAG: hypothetical protein NC191_00660 [Muribaculaceae bacterium]|nr:hypothetical protein [Muribaculaceae bacterium]